MSQKGISRLEGQKGVQRPLHLQRQGEDDTGAAGSGKNNSVGADRRATRDDVHGDEPARAGVAPAHRRRRRRPDVRDVLGEPARGASGRDGAGAGGSCARTARSRSDSCARSWRGDNEARSRIKKDGKNPRDKQCDGPCATDKARAIILRSWIEAGHEFVELETRPPRAAPAAAPRRAQEEAPRRRPPAPAPPPAEVDLDACTLHVAEKEEEKRDVSPRPQSRLGRGAPRSRAQGWFQAPTRRGARRRADSEPRRQRTGSAWSASSERAAPAPSTRGLVV